MPADATARRPTDAEANVLAMLAVTFTAAGYGAWVLADIAEAAERLMSAASPADELDRATSEPGYVAGGRFASVRRKLNDGRAA